MLLLFSHGSSNLRVSTILIFTEHLVWASIAIYTSVCCNWIYCIGGF